jgi:hypothetical protein
MKYAFYAIFFAVIGLLSYYLVESIRRPVNFNNTWSARKTTVHKHLEEIVELQKMYKILHNDTTYANSFDDMLKTFLSDSFTILKIEGDPYDTLKKADTVRVKYPARDSLGSFLVTKGFIKSSEYKDLFNKAQIAMKNKENNDDVKNYISFIETKINDYFKFVRLVPFSGNKEPKQFEMKSSTIALEGSRLAGNFAAPTFEVSTTVGDYMPEYATDEFSMYNPEFIPTDIVKIGDLNKVTTAGNW